MTNPSTARRFTFRKALLASTAAFGLLAILALGSNAQDAKKDDKPAPRSAIEVSGYTRPGTPDDRFGEDGQLIRRIGFEGDVKKFKIMGGTVYFAVFKNTGLVEGDTFGTGMASFDTKFEAGRSFRDSMSPRYDRKAKYLYLYQVVNDRALDPRLNQAKGKDGGIVFQIDDKKKGDPKYVPVVTEEIASFALKLLADPRHITSWGHFRESGFAANVVDVDGAGKIVRNVVDKVEKDEKIIQLSFSYLPAITTKLSDPSYSRHARSHSLGVLEKGFGVDQSAVGIKESKAYGDIKLVADEGPKGNIAWTGFAEKILKATDAAKEPEYVQLMYLSAEERAALGGFPIIPGGAPELFDDEVTRAIFRVDWQKASLLKQGSRSVVFGFTTDLPPVNAPIRIDTPDAVRVSNGLRLANYFNDEAFARVVGPDGVINIAGVDGTALALAVGTALGAAPTPSPAPAEGGAGFSGITGGFGAGLGGAVGGGSGGGFGTPGLGGGFSPGSGGGFGGGQGSGQGTTSSQATPQQAQAGTQTVTINFAATLTNTQAQAQSQSQFQLQQQQQQQQQNQNNRGHGNHGHHNNHGGGNCNTGHVVPAPASLLLGLLGLPGLWFLRRRKAADPIPEAVA